MREVFDEYGDLGEVNQVIVRRFIGYRKRLPFSMAAPILLDDGRRIARFLRSRGIDPKTMKAVTTAEARS